MNIKEHVLEITRKMPEDVTIEDIMARLYLLKKVQKGIDQADQGQMVSQEEAKHRMGRWLK
ncbi:MAG: hypothetical protein HQL75_01420 [Magnetococcales bacterium]|nr:hypothetical protein [Magnetococcales bacterium]